MGLKDKLNAARNPAESEQFALIAQQVAAVERDLHATVQAHYEALGMEPPADLMPAEERVEQLKEFVGYQVGGNLWGYFVAEQAPADLKNTDAARPHAGTPIDEWETTIETWAAGIREQLDGHDETADRELADRYSRRRFGVPIGVFEDAVVGWSPGRTMEAAFRGPINRDIWLLQQATQSITSVSVEDSARADDGREGER